MQMQTGYLLQRKEIDVNRQIVSRTTKWKMLRMFSRLCLATKTTDSRMIKIIADGGGLTALHYAARRGDAEIVEVLMEHGAKTSIKNDLGRDVLSFCHSFPQIRSAIHRVQLETSVVESMSSGVTFTLQRRLSTATSHKYYMYLISASSMLKLFFDDEDRKKNIDLCHQDLLEQGKLTRFEDLPLDAFVIFVSHQWNGFNHPDPNGRHIHVLCKTLFDLRDGVYDKVVSEAFSALVYQENRSTNASEWRELLSNAYIWFDFWCQPQPLSEKRDERRKSRLRKNLQLASASLASYVERSDSVMVLVRHVSSILFSCFSLYLSLFTHTHNSSTPTHPIFRHHRHFTRIELIVEREERSSCVIERGEREDSVYSNCFLPFFHEEKHTPYFSSVRELMPQLGCHLKSV